MNVPAVDCAPTHSRQASSCAYASNRLRSDSEPANGSRMGWSLEADPLAASKALPLEEGTLELASNRRSHGNYVVSKWLLRTCAAAAQREVTPMFMRIGVPALIIRRWRNDANAPLRSTDRTLHSRRPSRA